MDSQPLSQSEQDSLNHHLSVIKVSFALMIKSLAIIYSQRLYRGIDGGRTWQSFCETELNFGERLGYYFVKAYSVLETIEEYNATAPDPLPLPARESQTRALLSTPPDLIVPVWQATIARYGNNPTNKQITEMVQDVTVKEALIMKGISDADVLEALSTLAEKSEHGRTVVTELLVTGYLQASGDGDAIPLADLRLVDLKRYEDEQRREAIMRRVADEGGVVLTVYPNDSKKTAKILLASMTDDQAYGLIYHLEYCRQMAKERPVYDDEDTPTN